MIFTLWIDAQLPPAVALWISSAFGVDPLQFEIRGTAVRDLGLRNATDREIFFAARSAGAIVMTKDSDFVQLLNELGAPPKLIWITCGNTSNAYLQQLLLNKLPSSIQQLLFDTDLIEIS
jgi:predicted nuclease of predicted toxin-antitoxin system